MAVSALLGSLVSMRRNSARKRRAKLPRDAGRGCDVFNSEVKGAILAPLRLPEARILAPNGQFFCRHYQPMQLAVMAKV